MSAETTSQTSLAPTGAWGHARRHWMWPAAIVLALAIPWLFFDWTKGRHSGFALTMLSEIGLMSVFALSFNMQMGQTGLLSFGHAILFGLGGYCTAHALNAVKAGALWLPVELVPLVGGLGGLLCGPFSRRRSAAVAMASSTRDVRRCVVARSCVHLQG